MSSQLWIGASGYDYKHWAGGVFYPKGLDQRSRLVYYSRHFNTVELNNTFYRLPKEQTFSNWRQRTPDGFAFALKGSRYVTHLKKLADCRQSIDLFFRSG